MLTKLIVDLYGWIIEISLWFILLIAGIAGFHSLVPLLKRSGAILENELAWRILGAVVSPVVAFLILVVLFGPFLSLSTFENPCDPSKQRYEAVAVMVPCCRLSTGSRIYESTTESGSVRDGLIRI